MKFVKIKTVDDIKEQDRLIVSSPLNRNEEARIYKVEQIKVSEKDGTEVILKKNRNLYFNLDMYLDGKSWVKHVVKIIE